MPSESDVIRKAAKPVLTIAVGAYNDARFLPGCLDALLGQTFSDFKIIVSNNASTDETPQILEDYQKKDPRIEIIHQPENIGLTNNYNFLKSQADTEFFMWAACDDRWDATYVETIMTGMLKDTSVVLGFTPYQYFNEEGERYGSIRAFDYSGKSALSRLLRFFLTYDDGMTYGIYRTEAVKDSHFPIWWWINRNTPMNNAYAFLVYVLARGQFHLYGTEPLWLNCIKTTSHYEPFRKKQNVFLFLLFFLIRKINLIIIQFRNIWRGANSILLALVFLPILILRVLVDFLMIIINPIRKRLVRTGNHA